MSPEHRRYLLIEQGIGAAIVNLLLNGAIAWLMFHGAVVVPLWGQQSIAGDTIGTCLLLPLMTGLIVTRLARSRITGGTLAPLEWTPASHPVLGWLPAGTFARALTLGAVCVFVVAPPTLWVLSTVRVTALDFWWFVLFKATFAAALGAVVTPVISLWAIAGART